ncbi:hypothetical protein XPA_005149 [Xanthoria parietina]
MILFCFHLYHSLLFLVAPVLTLVMLPHPSIATRGVFIVLSWSTLFLCLLQTMRSGTKSPCLFPKSFRRSKLRMLLSYPSNVTVKSIGRRLIEILARRLAL